MEQRNNFTISKSDEMQNVFGVVMVSQMADGKYVVDLDGDMIEQEELEKMAYKYMQLYRTVDENHENSIDAMCIESFVITPEKCTIYGLTSNLYKCAWFCGFHIDDIDVWYKIKAGEYQAFSIGGSAIREDI